MITSVFYEYGIYFGIVERLNQIETQQTMMDSDVTMNTEFRIKWIRGEMGSLQ